MIKWVMLWHGFKHSLSTQQLQLVSVCQPHVKIIFGKSISVCALQESHSCSFEQRLGQPQALATVMGSAIDLLPSRGQNYSFSCSFRVKILKNKPKIESWYTPPWENTGYIILVYMVKGLEYEKIPLLVGGSFSKHGHHQIPCLCNAYCLWPVSLVVPVLCATLDIIKNAKGW